ncbi:MAG: riboflavin biosynthesis protein RibF [candidate division WOR-3 bacterium]|nr:riboflavin biosynthesis protein RibF [candidate division WOR-3 bacterium]
MLVLTDSTDPITEHSVCGIGSFDGIHRGHQAIVHRLKQLTGKDQRVGIITFAPLPFFILKKTPICCLTPRGEKEEIFEQLGIDFIYYFTFSDVFSRYSPERFVQLIALQIRPSVIVVGENFHFGNMRKGNADILTNLARGLFKVEVMAKVGDEGAISSTRIRELLLLGNIKAANRLLGRPYSVSGTVIKGKGKGKKLGFPTINIQTPSNKLIPLDGVYMVKINASGHQYSGAMFCRHDLLEVYIVEFSGDLYGKTVRIEFRERIRGIEHFADDSSLKAAIAADVGKITKQRT